MDTGANANVIGAEVADLFSVKGGGKKVKAMGAGEVRVTPVTIAHASLGNLPMDGADAVIAPLGENFGADGLIGRPLFQQFVVTLDFVSGTVTLTEPDKAVPPPGALALDLTFENGVPAIPAVVDKCPRSASR